MSASPVNIADFAERPSRARLIEARKETSDNYHRWQVAISLRDKVMRQVGADNSTFFRARELVRVTYKKWEAEMNSIDAPVTPDLLSEIENLEAEVGIDYRPTEEAQP